MERPEVRFARAADGAYLAYQVLGEGPTVLFWQEDSFALVDELWDSPQELAWHEGLAAFARVIIYDRRGTGLSSRNVAPGSLEVQVQDTLSVLDAEGIERAYFGGFLESCAPNVLLAATRPDRVQALVWALPSPRSTLEPDYPWGADATYVEAERVAAGAVGDGGLGAGLRRAERRRAGRRLEHGELRPLPRARQPADLHARRGDGACTDLAGDGRPRRPAGRPGAHAHDRLRRGERARAGGLHRDARAAHASSTTCPAARWRSSTSRPMHDAIRRFVGAERAPVGLDSVLATVLFTDIVGSTELAASVGDIRWKELLADHDRRARAELERFHGVYVDSTGDGLLARFDGPARAVRCARSIAEAVRPLGLEIRAGCHTGEIELDGDQIRGLAVHIGARVAAMAGTGEILTTSTVKDLTAGSGLTFEDAGEHTLKGVPDRWRLYRVVN